jgi:hypothetical protein
MAERPLDSQSIKEIARTVKVHPTCCPSYESSNIGIAHKGQLMLYALRETIIRHVKKGWAHMIINEDDEVLEHPVELERAKEVTVKILIG